MSCRPNYDPCLDGKLNQIGSYASAARQSAQSAAASAAEADSDAAAAAASAAAAAASAEIAGIYLGPFAVAPTTDNEGGPLQEGMLYYNTVSNGLFVWNGTVWASADFNEFTNFLATGTTFARNLVTRSADVVNVKDFGAVGNGVADDRLAFQNAIATGKTVYIPDGTYNLTTGVTVFTNGSLILIGSSKDKVKLISNVGTWMFLGNLSNVQFENITFDGRRVRDVNGWPYSNPQTSNGSFRAIQAEAPQGNDSTSVIIDKCDFINFSSLPIFFYSFYNARVTNSKFYKTLDPGFVFCNNVFWSNNITEFCADNGVSMSRGNNNVVVESSIFKDCQSSGIWISGFAIAGTGTVTATGASYNVLDQVTLTFSATGQTGFDRAYITQKSGGLEATYKIKQITSPTTAIAECINAIDPAFQGVAIATWEFSPSLGPKNAIISNNLVIGGYTGGIQAYGVNKRIKISGNVLIRNGWCADSETYTFGSIAQSSTTLNVDNASNFNNNDYIIIEPISSQRDYFITRIANIVGNTITTVTAPPITYSNEKIYRVHTGSSVSNGYANHILISGDTSGFPDTISNQISISENIMSDCSGEAIMLAAPIITGSGGGTVKNISIKGNSILYPTTVAGPAGPFPINLRHAVFIDEQNPNADPSENIIVSENYYTGYGSIVNFRQNSLAIRNYIVCANNTYPNGSGFFARDIATSTILTDNYRTSHYDQYGTLTADAITTSLQFPAWTVGTVVAGVMNVTQSTISFTGTNPTTQITDFTKGVNSDLLVFSLRNSDVSAGNTITIVHNTSKIRTQSGSNIVLGPGSAALFAFLNNTIVIQIG
jgi:hypothetical protein